MKEFNAMNIFDIASIISDACDSPAVEISINVRGTMYPVTYLDVKNNEIILGSYQLPSYEDKGEKHE